VKQPHPNNDWYQELCAVAAIGEASPSEFEDLQQHLAECDGCRELYADFRRIASDDLGEVAVLKRAEPSDSAADVLNEDDLLCRLLHRASQERAASALPVVASTPAREERSGGRGFARAIMWLRRPALSYGSLALIFCVGASLATYRLRDQQLKPSLARLDSQLQRWQSLARSTEAREKTISESLQQARSEREASQKSLAEAQAKYAQLRAQLEVAESQLSSQRAQLARQESDLRAARNAGVDKDKQIVDLEASVQNALFRVEQQHRLAEDLQKGLASARRQVAELESRTPEAQGFTNADAEQIFGARDLHIVDVYDVDSRGKTKRTYGRVYYVQKKLLIFYAFDLQDKKHNREAAGFQAWGYREANESNPESLGLFRLDDTSTNRWVLQVNNPGVLQHVDAVFVTLEPAHGSPVPRGRKLLYANLLSPPNHP